MEAMAVVRNTANAIHGEQLKARSRDADLQTWRNQRATAARGGK